MRKCRYCRVEIPKAKDSAGYQRAGYCDVNCMADYGHTKALAKIEKAKRVELRQVQAKKSATRKDKREFNRKDTAWQHKQCKTVFNRMRVLEERLWFKKRDLEPECISCGKKNMDWCCGHFKTVGAQSNLRYDRMNTYLQCNRYCNLGLSGNIAGNKTTRGYRAGLLERFGHDVGRRVIDYCESHTEAYKWDWLEMEEWRKTWSARIREIEKLL